MCARISACWLEGQTHCLLTSPLQHSTSMTHITTDGGGGRGGGGGAGGRRGGGCVGVGGVGERGGR